MSNESTMLRPDDAARVLKLSRSKVYAMLKSGDLPCVKMGRSVRVPEAALNRWLQEQVSDTDSPSDNVDIDGVLAELGFCELKKGVSMKQIAPAIVRFAEMMKKQNPLIRHVAREEVLSRLTTAGVRTPSKMLALAFGEDR